MQVLFLGAGASYGSEPSGRDVPPLGDALFKELQAFDPHGWGGLPGDLAALFADDFERGMTELSTVYPGSIVDLQRAMAGYFYRFEGPSTDNLYRQLARKMKARSWRGTVVTLNYERLIELSMCREGLQPVVTGTSGVANALELVFPHGCCHLFCEGGRGIAGQVRMLGMNVQTNGPVVPLCDATAFWSRLRNEAFPPVMSYFEPAKRTTAGASFIDWQRQRYAELVRSAETVAIIGIRVRPADKHIWEPLSSATGKLVYCGGPSGAAEFEDWRAGNPSRAGDVIIPAYFSDGLPAICAELGL